MKAIFLCDDKTRLSQVYNEKLTNEIKDNIEDFSGEVYSKDAVLKSPTLFHDTEYIFSTWGIPNFEENEIRLCFPKLKCIFYAAGTVQAFARPFFKCGTRIFSAWAANAVPVAEYTVAQIILANKGFYSTSRILNTKKYTDSDILFRKYPGNYDSKVGIIGAGMIGKLVIKMLKSYKLEVLTFDPFLDDSAADELGVKKVSLEEIFSQCDVVSNHLANNKDTQDIFTYELFSLMKPYSTFLNTGRGAQVVESDLIKLLHERPDVTALLDVTSPEPPLNDSEFYELDNCILTPHIAGSSGNEFWRVAEYSVAEFKRYIENKPCKYEVTLEMLETMA